MKTSKEALTASVSFVQTTAGVGCPGPGGTTWQVTCAPAVTSSTTTSGGSESTRIRLVAASGPSLVTDRSYVKDLDTAAERAAAPLMGPMRLASPTLSASSST